MHNDCEVKTDTTAKDAKVRQWAMPFELLIKSYVDGRTTFTLYDVASTSAPSSGWRNT
jgi:hypothetical protein